MIDNILIVGDSFLYGEETPEIYIDNIEQKIFDVFKTNERKLDGRLVLPIGRDYIWKWIDVYKSINNYNQLAFDFSFGGHLKRQLKIPVTNLSIPGASMNQILNILLTNKNEFVNEKTLLIVGVTYPYRTTRFEYRNDVALVQSYNLTAEDDDHERFLELSTLYGDDTLSKIYHVMGAVGLIKQIFKNNNLIIIDPYDIYRTTVKNRHVLKEFKNKIESAISPDASMHFKSVELTQTFFDENTFDYTFFDAMDDVVNEKIGNAACVLGHPSHHSHAVFADRYLLPYIIEQGWI